MGFSRWSAMVALGWMVFGWSNNADAGPSTLAAGADFTCAVVDEGVQCWGSNLYGALGNPAFGDVSTATDVPLLKPGTHAGVTALTAGNDHVCALVNSGVMCWGSNIYGALGDGSNKNSPVPVVAIPSGAGVSAIAAGAYHTCAVVNGGLKCWGRNDIYQLGDGSQDNSISPKIIFPAGSGVTDVGGGRGHTCAVRNAGLDCWGYNYFGQIGNGAGDAVATPTLILDEGSGVSAVAAGSYFTCVIQGAGQSAAAKCWGDNSSGELGTNNHIGQDDAKLATPVINAVGKVAAIVAGGFHACVIQNGSTKCWGSNRKGQLGTGSTTEATVATLIPAITPVSLAAGATHTCVRQGTAPLDVYCWGEYGHGRLGTNRDNRFLQPTSTASAGEPVIALAQGGRHGCMVTLVGAVRCWGSNAGGQLGDGSGTTPHYYSTQVSGIASGATAVAAGRVHSCAIVMGAVECWGSNDLGQIGNNSVSPSLIPFTSLPSSKVATKLSTGAYHTCAIGNDGTYCWGYNANHQASDLDVDEISTPKKIAALLGKSVTDISAGYAHTCAVVNGGVQCWGRNSSGQLGDPMSSADHDQPYSVIAEGSNVTGVAAGDFHTCAIVNGGLKCWGANYYGQLGNNSETGSAVPVEPTGFVPMYGITGIVAGGYHTCANTHDVMSCWGSNESGELGTGTKDNTPWPTKPLGLGYGDNVVVTDVAAGIEASCAIVGGQARCWGSNLDGALGVVVLDYRTTPAKVIANDVLFANRFEFKP